MITASKKFLKKRSVITVCLASWLQRGPYTGHLTSQEVLYMSISDRKSWLTQFIPAVSYIRLLTGRYHQLSESHNKRSLFINSDTWNTTISAGASCASQKSLGSRHTWTWSLNSPWRRQEEKMLLLLMRVHPAAMKRGDEMRRLRLLYRCFLKRQEGIIMLHLIRWDLNAHLKSWCVIVLKGES